MYFAIERQHDVDKMRFIFDAPNQSYSCGRAKENMIICLSLLVSRRHCLFVRDSDDLYITDLGSSNGVYVNRVLQSSHQMVKLNENDIIGLGCANIDPNDNTLYTYKVSIIESSLDKKVEILVKEVVALPSTILNGNTSSRTSTSSTECTLGKKRFNSDNIKVPNKKFKNTDKNAHSPKATSSEEIVSCTNKSLAGSSTNNSVETESHIVDMEIEDDIEIIHTSLVQEIKNQNIKDHKSATYLDNNKLNFNAKMDMDIIIDENNKEESDNSNRNINKIDIKENISSNIDTTNDALNPSKNSNFICPENQIIIVEDEQTEDDEEASIDVNMTRDASLIKLKKIKYEPKTRFSEIDVIDLSDDEEEVFPCSQLFDIKYEENTENDNEIKREYINNDDQNIEKIDLDVDDEVIFLTDSEDEDNPWLERLSRSQLLNEDKKFDPNNVIVKNEIDLGIWQEDDLLNRNTNNFKKSENSNNNLLMTETKSMDINDVDSSNKSILKNIDDTNINIDDNSKKSENNNKNNNNSNLLTTETKEMDINDVGPSNKSNLKNIDDINTNIDDNSKKSENNNNYNNNNNLLITETKAMDINDVNKPSNKSTLKISDTNKRKTNVVLSTEIDKQILEGMKQKSVVRKSVTTLKRLIPIIEPLNLPTRRNRVNCKDKAQKDTEKSPSKLRKKKKMLELEEKVNDNFYIKKQKHHEKPSTSTADCHSSNETKAISKDQKKMIIEKRKIKLKEIAEEKKKLSIKNDKNIKRRTAKAIAKVSLKNRGDFLINEQEPSTSKSFAEKSVNLPKSNNQDKERLTDIANMLKTSSIFKTQQSYQKDVSKDTVNDITISLKQSLQLDNTNAIQVSKKSKKDSKVIDSKEKKGSSNKKIRKSNENVKISERDRLTEPAVQKENLSSNIVKSNFKSKEKKKVTFLEKLEIREYEIDQCNSLKKLVGKDAPIPPNKLRTPPTSAEWSPKLEEFLFYIFKWNPVWLEEQRYLKGDPPIVPQSELQSMRLSYDSYKQYYKIVMPLLLLEIWCAMTKEFEMIEKNKQRATMMCSVVENPTCTPIPSTNLFLTTLKLEVLVKKEDLSNKVHPIYGDLVCVEYITNAHRKQNVNRIFAYVTNMQQMIITNFTLYNQELIKYVKNPYAILTYTLLTRPLQHDFPVNRVQRIRTVMYLRANIRMVQALQYFPQSPLSDLILNPKIEEYQLPPMDEQFTCSSLVTRDNLNPKQMEAVYKVTKTVLKKEDKLCFIQGPPGTGKSKVIVNLVSQILYSEHTNRKSLRILICAPSNAAIDEIVLRLLNIRSKLKKNRFNMVRIGRLESMHLMAKPISVTELGKRHLTKISQEAVYSDNTEELAILEAKINSLKAELSSFQQKDEDKKKEIKRRLMETSMRYELVKCGKPINEFSSKDRAKYQRMAENIILAGADIIACTLSSCYTNQMESIFGGYKERISVCIVDEATQSCEAETLIPLMLGVKTLVLVGDPNQLPATVLSQQAKKLKLDQSVFSRIQNVFTSKQNNPIIMLNMQYRMDYAISYWPNKYFYDGKLKNSIDFRMKFPFHSYRILDHKFKQNEDKFSNTIEAEFIAKTILAMLTFTSWENVNPISLGVLTPYNNQRTLILNKINEKISSVPDNLRNKISFEVNTVDSFQGQERDIIIMSCVRSHGIGFLSDRQRLCVALTRAKYSLILCGNFNTFLKDKMWNALLSDAKSRGVLCRVDAHATPAFIRQFIIK